MNEQSLTAGTVELLEWIAREHRTYEQTMDAWRSSCPRLTIWEDALLDSYVALTNRGDTVRLTARGLAALQLHRAG